MRFNLSNDALKIKKKNELAERQRMLNETNRQTAERTAVNEKESEKICPH